MEKPEEHHASDRAEASAEYDPVKLGAALLGGLIGGAVILRALSGLIGVGVKVFGAAIATEVLRKPAGSREVVDSKGEPLRPTPDADAGVEEVEIDFGQAAYDVRAAVRTDVALRSTDG